MTTTVETKLTTDSVLHVIGTIDRKQAADLIGRLASALGSGADDIEFRMDYIHDYFAGSGKINVSVDRGFGSNFTVTDSRIVTGE